MELLSICLCLYASVGVQSLKPNGPMNVSAQASVSRLIASLPPKSSWRDMLEHGARGDGVHHPWMDDMRAEGIKLAEFTFEFDWSGRGKKLANWRIVSEEYFRDYDQEVMVTEANQLAEINATSLKKKLDDAALLQAKLGSWFEYPHRRRGIGYRIVLLADNEWLPVALTRWYGVYDPGTTPLMHAALLGNVERVRELLSGGADVNAVSPNGSTALIYAAASVNPAVVQILLSAGANVNSRMKNGGNALTTAVVTKHLESVKTLLKAHANPNSKDFKGESALSVAVRNHYDDIAALLKKAGAQSEP